MTFERSLTIISGQGWMEMKEIYHLGLREYITSYYNMIDSVSQALYLASYALRVVVYLKIASVTGRNQGSLNDAKEILENETAFFACGNSTISKHSPGCKEDYKAIRSELFFNSTEGYWLRGCMIRINTNYFAFTFRTIVDVQKQLLFSHFLN